MLEFYHNPPVALSVGFLILAGYRIPGKLIRRSHDGKWIYPGCYYTRIDK